MTTLILPLLKIYRKTLSADLLTKGSIPAHSFSASDSLEMEKDILGIYVSAHPLSIYRNELENLSSHKHLYIRSHSIDQLRPGQFVQIAGLLVQIRRQFTRQGKIMAFLLLEDETGLFEAIVFPETFHRHYPFLTKDALLILKGYASYLKEKDKIIVQEISLIHSPARGNGL